jgi:hypothetical protein
MSFEPLSSFGLLLSDGGDPRFKKVRFCAANQGSPATASPLTDRLYCGGGEDVRGEGA